MRPAADEESGRASGIRTLIWAWFLAPSPFLSADFSGAFRGVETVVPFIILLPPLISSPASWAWHVMFVLPFLLLFEPLWRFLKARIPVTGVRLVLLAPIYLAYWTALWKLWFLVPESTRHHMLGYRE